ncbi:MAG: Gfo/Idh/MocA family oxidoreductase [Methylobacterium mesophilicum]|nr:Gfo/Idh/MocA family oxidoreductase [Methylobacterium mesophilicum]
MSPRIGVLGCGYWGANHVRTLRSLGALGAVADIHPERAQALADEHGCLALSPDEILAHPALDALVIALPAQFHAEMATRAIGNNKDVLVEKPIALTVADAERAVKAAEAAGRVFMTGHILRFNPAFERLLALVEDGTLGTLRYVHAHRLGLGKFHAEFDALWDLGPHDLSMILALTGTEPVEVRGEGAAFVDGLNDFAHLHMRFPGNVAGHLFVSRLSPYRERRLSVVGSDAMAVFDDLEPWERKVALYRHKIWDENGRWKFAQAESEFLPVEPGMPLTRELEHFIACVETRANPRTDGEEAIRVLRILTAGDASRERALSA